MVELGVGRPIWGVGTGVDKGGDMGGRCEWRCGSTWLEFLLWCLTKAILRDGNRSSDIEADE